MQFKCFIFMAILFNAVKSAPFEVDTILAPVGSTVTLNINYTGYNLNNLVFTAGELKILETIIYSGSALKITGGRYSADTSVANILKITISGITSYDYKYMWVCYALGSTYLYAAHLYSTATSACDTSISGKPYKAINVLIGSTVNLGCNYTSYTSSQMYWDRISQSIYVPGGTAKPGYTVSFSGQSGTMTVGSSLSENQFYLCYGWNTGIAVTYFSFYQLCYSSTTATTTTTAASTSTTTATTTSTAATTATTVSASTKTATTILTTAAPTGTSPGTTATSPTTITAGNQTTSKTSLLLTFRSSSSQISGFSSALILPFILNIIIF